MGPVTNDPGLGNPASASPLSFLIGSQYWKLMVQGQPATVQFMGRAPGFVGLDQVNFIVPSGVPSGEVDIVLQLSNGTGTNTVKLSMK